MPIEHSKRGESENEAIKIRFTYKCILQKIYIILTLWSFVTQLNTIWNIYWCPMWWTSLVFSPANENLLNINSLCKYFLMALSQCFLMWYSIQLLFMCVRCYETVVQNTLHNSMRFGMQSVGTLTGWSSRTKRCEAGTREAYLHVSCQRIRSRRLYRSNLYIIM